MSLTQTVLRSLSIQQLYELSKTRNLSVVEDEIQRRLLSSDRDVYIEVIDLLYEKRNEPNVKQWLDSYNVQKGLIGAIPWKIGVVYNYTDQSYRTDKVSIILGKPTAYMTNRKYFKPTWLNSSQSHLTLREVINRTGNPINNNISVITQDPNLDQKIRESLLNSDSAEITVCTFIPAPGTSFQSYSNPLPYGEHKQMYPCSIKIGDFEHRLIQYANDINVTYQTFHVPISKSPEVEKLVILRKSLNI